MATMTFFVEKYHRNYSEEAIAIKGSVTEKYQCEIFRFRLEFPPSIVKFLPSILKSLSSLFDAVEK